MPTEIIFANPNLLRIRVHANPATAPEMAPYVVPEVVFPGSSRDASTYTACGNPKYNVSTSDNAAIHVGKVGEMPDIFSISNLVMKPQVLQYTIPIPSPECYIYGYGEHDYYFFLERNISLSLWNTDNGTPWMNPMYGVHPVFFFSCPFQTLYFASLHLNSNVQRAVINTNSIDLTFAGGIVNAFVIVGDSPMDVLRQYHQLIGTSIVPPLWALGVHQCRWGYHTLTEAETVVTQYAAHGIPLDAMWNDIDYMEQYRIFTTSPSRYPEAALRAWVDGLHAKNIHYIQIVDPGVAYANYSVFNDGLAKGVYVNESGTQNPLINIVWPGWTVFPDFTGEKATLWWIDQVKQYHDRIPVDGIWLDMNELGTFCGGYCTVPLDAPWTYNWSDPNVWHDIHHTACVQNCTVANSPLNYPPINPLTNGQNISWHTLDMTADLALGKYYDTKAFYGLMEERATHLALQKITKKRPFILSRASFVGSGRYTAHWTGDNSASWSRETGGIADSIQGVLAANLWGINIVGADIGGFGGTTTEPLIVRWYQLGAFYTFMRNHHGLDDTHQEPYVFSQNAQDSMKGVIANRYRLLPYLMTEIIKAHYLGGPVLRHPSVEFPEESGTYAPASSGCFMFGSSIFVAPVLEENATSVTKYLPIADWFRLWQPNASVAGGKVRTYDSPLYDTSAPAFIVAGTALPLFASPNKTVIDTQQGGLEILCALSKQGYATGSFIVEDGESILPEVIDSLDSVAITCTANSITLIVNQDRKPLSIPQFLKRVTIYNWEKANASMPAPVLTATGIDQFTVVGTMVDNQITFELNSPIDISIGLSGSWTGGGSSNNNNNGGNTPSNSGEPNAVSSSDAKVVVPAVFAGLFGATTLALIAYILKKAPSKGDYTELHES
jgi:alpha-glucosidase (family GH31 glycosyl hydrolase)